MLIKISIDTWRDIFDFFLPGDRRQLALKLNELGDREFSDICQKWLHEWTKNVCFGPIQIIVNPPPTPNVESAPYLQCWDQTGRSWKQEAVPFADVELPDNIQTFEEIQLTFLDPTVLQFLHRMHPLFRSVNLRVQCEDDSLEESRAVLVHLLPLLTSGGIETVSLDNIQLLYTMRDNSPALFFAIKQLNLEYEEDLTGAFIELLLQWLGTRRADDQPRKLIMQALLANANAMPIIENLHQHFLNSTSPVSFFIWILSSQAAVQKSTTQNVETNEQLVVRKPYVNRNLLLIGRCPVELDGTKWVKEMDRITDEQDEWKARRWISICAPTLGSQMEEEAMPEEEEEDADQPGPSKKPALVQY